MAQTEHAINETGACTALEPRPLCPSNKNHGYMELRPLTRQTKEQRFCGVWYDCSDAGCHSSVLYESAALKAQLAEAMSRIKVAYLALRGKKKRAQYLKGCAPWVAAELLTAE